MYPGEQYRLNTRITAIDTAEEPGRVIQLPAGTVVNVAARIANSHFVQITADSRVYEVLIDDLIDATARDHL